MFGQRQVSSATKKRLVIVVVVVLLLLVLIVGSLISLLRRSSPSSREKKKKESSCESSHESYRVRSDSQLGRYSSSSIVVDDDRCSRIGKSLLGRGGNAIDAGIAAALCNGVVNAHSMGIGGGNVLLIYSNHTGESYQIIERERAPLLFNRSLSRPSSNSLSPFIGAMSIGTPGEVLGYAEAYRRFGGGVSWSSLFEETIRLCEEGFEVSHPLSFALAKHRDEILLDPQLSEIFVKDVKKKVLYGEGDRMFRKKLGRTLRRLSEDGVETFYRGDLARLIVEEIGKRGGLVSRRDLRDYRVDIRPSLRVNFSDSFEALSTSAPSSGPLLLFILNVLHGYHFDPATLNVTSSTALFYHRLIEAFKFAFAQRTELADPEEIPLEEWIDKLISKEFAQTIRKKINDQRTFPAEFYGRSSVKIHSTGGTSHLSVVDRHGNALAMTSTINTYFGSMIVGEHTGIIYNNELDDFSWMDDGKKELKSSNNVIQPGKRPLSSQSPLIIIDREGNLRQILGASGANKIFTSVAQVSLLNLLFDQNIQQSVDFPRVHHHLSPDELLYEHSFDQKILAELARRGHQLKCIAYGGSVVQAIEWRRKERQYWAFADRRKGGTSQGF